MQSAFDSMRKNSYNSFMRLSKEPFYHDESLLIYNDDILTITDIGDETIDLIVTSPPYNVDIKYNTHDDTTNYEDYLNFTEKWLLRCYGFLKKDGRYCLNIPLDKNKGGTAVCICRLHIFSKKNRIQIPFNGNLE